MVLALQPRSGLEGLPLDIIAGILGLIVAVVVRHVRLGAAISLVLGGFLVSAAYLQELSDSTSEGATPLSEGATPLSQPAAPAAPLQPQRPSDEPGAPVPLETLSVVLPCAFEGEFAAKTVESVRANTARARLHEIIVVDDGNKPPLEEELVRWNTPALRGSDTLAPVKVVRHEKTLGLITSKKVGGDSATGDVIVFLDCHVKPRIHWEEALLSQMRRAGDHRTVAVPVITSLNVDTWEELPGAAGGKACYMMLNGDFTWLSAPGRDVPMMSGGLLGISRKWWEETGGLDEDMVAWGGENLDQSLRTWLCGGRIEVAEGSFVAHMWRDPNNPKTMLRYPIPTEQVMRNKARAVTAWFGELTAKTLEFPEYEDFARDPARIGDMSRFDELKQRLKCGSFGSYIQRFSYVYIDTGLISEHIFQIREESTSRCLQRVPRRSPPHGVVLAPCGSGDAVPELQMWHEGNRDRSRPGDPCCSGIMAWNFLQCLFSIRIGGQVETYECEILGYNSAQFFRLPPAGEAGKFTWRGGGGCVGPASQAGEERKSHSPKLMAKGKKCESIIEAVNANVVSLADGTLVPERFLIKRQPRGSQELCAEYKERSSLLMPVLCNEREEKQTFTAVQHRKGGKYIQVRWGETGKCLDASDGQVTMSGCKDDEDDNDQAWHVEDGHLLWDSGAKVLCLQIRLPNMNIITSGAMPASRQKQDQHDEKWIVLQTWGSQINMAEMPKFSFMTCVVKEGQQLQRLDADEQGTFQLRDMATGLCLSAPSHEGHWQAGRVVLQTCSEQNRWRELQDREQVQHVSSSWCLDAGNEVEPILYPCHEHHAQRKQRFEVVETSTDSGIVWVRTKPGWEDNGRIRFFERCLDYMPEPDTPVTVQQCGDLDAKGVRWSRIGLREPSEWTIWRQMAKLPPGATPLGGGAEPPPA